jgi:hypothetical protein
MFIRTRQLDSIDATPPTPERAPVMPATEIVAETWPSFFNSLSACSELLLGTVSVLGSHSQERLRELRRPLHEIGYSVEEDVLALTLGSPRGAGAVRYFIRAPQRIQMARSDGATELLIDEAGGTRTLICLFESAGAAPWKSRSNGDPRGSEGRPSEHADDGA